MLHLPNLMFLFLDNDVWIEMLSNVFKLPQATIGSFSRPTI